MSEHASLLAAAPAVTIGLPVYNGEDTLEQVVDALLAQTFCDFELIISDNASTDGTEQICRAFAAANRRIRYVRQPVNVGAEDNFRFVFKAARSEYFMWAAADDLRSVDFIASNLAFLRAHPDYGGSTCPVRFTGGEFDEIGMGDRSLTADAASQRVADFFRTWHSNGRFYSLLRRADVEDWRFLEDMSFLGSDWTLVLHMACKGKLNRLTTGWVELGRGGFSSKVDLFAYYRKSWVDWVLPFNRVSAYAVRLARGGSTRTVVPLLARLLWLNVTAFRAQFVAARRRSPPRARGSA